MYFHRILASAIISHGFAVLFNFIITTVVTYVPKMGHPSLHAALLDKRIPSLSNDKHYIHWIVWFGTPRFQQELLKLGLLVWLPLNWMQYGTCSLDTKFQNGIQNQPIKIQGYICSTCRVVSVCKTITTWHNHLKLGKHIDDYISKNGTKNQSITI